MNNKLILESLASDLKHVAIGLHRGSYRMAERFSEEALKRASEVDKKSTPRYVLKILNNLPSLLGDTDQSRKAEDLLMFSTLVQNYVLFKQV